MEFLLTETRLSQVNNLQKKYKHLTKFLINFFHNLSAAHCVHQKGNDPLNAKNLQVLLGAHDLSDYFEEGRQICYVNRIITHPEWDSNDSMRYTNDISIIKLKKHLKFSEFIRPICITPHKSLNNFKYGTLIGWGDIDDNHKYENISSTLELSILNLKECLLDYYLLGQIAWTKSFCAGQNGAGACVGDSGSGLYVEVDDQFYLRGIVSSSYMKSCSSNHMTVFTDISLYYDFMFDVSCA